jgi:hypothetical protein
VIHIHIYNPGLVTWKRLAIDIDIGDQEKIGEVGWMDEYSETCEIRTTLG